MKTNCPYCSYIATEHETLDGELNKKDGDISFCINCGEVGMFRSVGIVKTRLSYFGVKTQEEIKRIREAWLQTRSMARLYKKEGSEVKND